jgi:hypothetical protein
MIELDNFEPTILVCDPIYRRKAVMLTEAELTLVNLIREDKGIGRVMVITRFGERERASA